MDVEKIIYSLDYTLEIDMWPKYILWYGNLFYFHIPSFHFYSTYIVFNSQRFANIKLCPILPALSELVTSHTSMSDDKTNFESTMVPKQFTLYVSRSDELTLFRGGFPKLYNYPSPPFCILCRKKRQISLTPRNCLCQENLDNFVDHNIVCSANVADTAKYV